MNISQTRQQLPVYQRRGEIMAAIDSHQVVVISGETGSGKTTQLPQFCLELGRGGSKTDRKMIGHTQPRRLAARSVAQRIADEMGCKLGEEVGYQVRFTDQVSQKTKIKLMTDGILLAEIRSDPLLARYDTIIVDEAHERSLNIDFILGFLAQLLPKRPDLKVIITSATIDAQRFAEHFSKALGGKEVPVLEVSGRTYPVEIRYRPLDNYFVHEGTANQEPATNQEVSAAKQDSYPDNHRDGHPDNHQNGHPDNHQDGHQDNHRDGHPDNHQNGHPDNHPDNHRDDHSNGYPSNTPGSLPTATTATADSDPIDQITGICQAVEELLAEAPGDILVFLAGERDIRDTEQGLSDYFGSRIVKVGERSTAPGAIEVVPLYARLSNAEQQVIFQAHTYPRIVLATNVAETSLTVPGIKYVIDPGLARISRYSNRTKVQRLPIEEISQASANQRSGRCGRVSAGVAIRLYSAENYAQRPRFTEPEILRTSLASVILSMASLKLGKVADFPFLDAPDPRAVKDGEQLLLELGALDMRGAGASATKNYRLTRLGRRIAGFPIDPRLARMLIEADTNGCLSETLIIVAALSMQDVRLRPLEKQAAADAAHQRFLHRESDFLTYLNLWRYLRTMQKELSGRKFRQLCETEFLHYLRTREWQDLVSQLRRLAADLGMKAEPLTQPDRRCYQLGNSPDNREVIHACAVLTEQADSDGIHRALLSGMLSHLGNWDERGKIYRGARNAAFTIWPGSGLADHCYDWIMAHELVETSRLFARSVAKINPDWIESAASNLLKRSYGAIFWDAKKEQAQIFERVSLFGLTITADRPRSLGTLPAGALPGLRKNPAAFLESSELPRPLVSFITNPDASPLVTPKYLAHLLFLYHQLVLRENRLPYPFVARQEKAWAEASELQKRTRQAHLLPSEAELLAFFASRISQNVTNPSTFARWWREQNDPHCLDYPADFLFGRGDYARQHTREPQFSSWSTGAGWQTSVASRTRMEQLVATNSSSSSAPTAATTPSPDLAADRDRGSSNSAAAVNGGSSSHGKASGGGATAAAAPSLTELGFPDYWLEDGMELPIRYRFAPGREDDGLTVQIPLRHLPRLKGESFEWLVPGLWPDLFTALLRGLPKTIRRQLDPAPQLGLQIAHWLAEYCSQPQPVKLSQATPVKEKQADELANSLSRLAKWADASGVRVQNQTSKTAGDKQAGTTANTNAATVRGNQPATDKAAVKQFPAWDQKNRTAPSAPLSEYFIRAVDHLQAVSVTQKDYLSARQNLPSYLQIRFRVKIGKNWVGGADLSRLQKQYAKAGNQAARDNLQAALQLALAEQQLTETTHQQQIFSDNWLDSDKLNHPGHTQNTPHPGHTRNNRKRSQSANLSTDNVNQDFQPVAKQFALGEVTAWPEQLRDLPLPDPVVGKFNRQTARLYPAFHPGYWPCPGGVNPLSGQLHGDLVPGFGPNLKELPPNCVADQQPWPGSYPEWITPANSSPAVKNSATAASNSLYLRLWSRSDWAMRLHHWGIVELVAQQLALSAGRITSRWNAPTKLALSQSPYSSTENLVAELQLVAAAQLADTTGVDTWQIRSYAQLQALAADWRDLFEDQVWKVAQSSADICRRSGEIRQALSQPADLTLLPVAQSLQQQLQTLVRPGFLRDFQTNLPQLSRLLQALQIRWQKASQPGRLNVDQDRYRQWLAGWELWLQAQQRLCQIPLSGRPLGKVDTLLAGQNLLWEWYINLFAQELTGRQKVSYQRLTKLLQQI